MAGTISRISLTLFIRLTGAKQETAQKSQYKLYLVFLGPSVADPGSGNKCLLTPGSGIQDEHLRLHFPELETNFLGKNT
jgi:hypothetical protein